MNTNSNYEKIEGKVTLIDTYDPNYEDYFDEFIEYCEDRGYVVKGKGTDMEGLYLGGKISFFDWYDNHSEETLFWDDFRWASKHEPVNTYCVVNGSCGLWYGARHIVPTFCDNLYDAVMKCVDNMDYVILEVENNTLNITGIHHDGRNHFSINLLRPDAYYKGKEWDDEIDGNLDDFLADKNNWSDFCYVFFGQ